MFYTFIASLRRKIREEVKESSATHQFIRQLRDQRKLVRCYTQNIDGLEVREGLCTDLNRGKGSKARFTKKAMQLPRSSADAFPGGSMDGGCEVVQLHGDLDALRCTICRTRCRWEDHNSEAIFAAGKAPRCEKCDAQDQDRQHRGKRGTAIGSLRPNVVLYGEEHPAADTLSAITTHDLRFGPDVLLILGTSLKVHGLKVLVREHAKAVHTKTGKKGKVIFVNLTPPPGSVWNDVIDYWVAMDCDEWVRKTRNLRPSLFQSQAELVLQVVKNLDGKACSKGKGKTPANGNENKENVPRGQSPHRGPGKSLPKVAPFSKRGVVQDKDAARLNLKSERDLLRTPTKPKQLHTPPTSRPEARSRGRPPKASICATKELTTLAAPKPLRTPSSLRQNRQAQVQVCEEEDSMLVTPSKRRKTDICIWEDDKVDTTQDHGIMAGQEDCRIAVVASEQDQHGFKEIDSARGLSTVQVEIPIRGLPAQKQASPQKKRKRA